MPASLPTTSKQLLRCKTMKIINSLKDDPPTTIATLIGLILIVVVLYIAIAKPYWAGEYAQIAPRTEAQTEEWTPPTIQTYKIPIDTGSGHVLHMYDPNGRITCLLWISSNNNTLPLGCVAGKR